MKRVENPNDHKRVTPKTGGSKNKKDDKKFTAYDTSKTETATPQKVREGNEAPAQDGRNRKAKGSA